jgi:outer membrane protein assembly factor BamB
MARRPVIGRLVARETTLSKAWEKNQESSMDFVIRNLSVLAYAQGFTLWHYKAPASALSVLARPGFFDDAGDMLAAGDMVMMSARDGGSVAFVSEVGEQVRLAALA